MKFRIKNKTKTIFVIQADNDIWGILPIKILHFFSLLPEKEVELSCENEAKLFSEIEKFAWDKLLNFFSFRERSIWECNNFLSQLPLKSEIAEKLISKAVSMNFVNDKRFAEIYTESLIIKEKSLTEIKNKLFVKHINKKIIDEVLKIQYSAEKKDEIIKENVKKTLSRYSRFSKKEKLEKCLNYLTRRGFSYWEVKENIEELMIKD
ncbi:MAG: RecX family transcriptional regulator [Candidatus Cloacimonetes bacterium]|nr:RecX family transcriptional regulator [Candidatus Cloacimonadota bacterium]